MSKYSFTPLTKLSIGGLLIQVYRANIYVSNVWFPAIDVGPYHWHIFQEMKFKQGAHLSKGEEDMIINTVKSYYESILIDK